MARRKKHTAEQVVNLLRQIEVAVANGKAGIATLILPPHTPNGGCLNTEIAALH